MDDTLHPGTTFQDAMDQLNSKAEPPNCAKKREIEEKIRVSLAFMAHARVHIHACATHRRLQSVT